MSLEFLRSAEPRRRHKRYSPRRTEVVCIPRGFWSGVLRKNAAVHLRDLSLGGAQVLLSRGLAPGARTDLTLTFPGFPDPVAVEADVRWCRRDTLALAPRWIAGLTFKRMSPRHEATLQAVDRTYVG